MDSAEIDHNFEPQFRERSNTWPLRPSREMVEAHGDGSPASEDSNTADGQSTRVDPLGLTAKKSGSRRNAWGNLSYADLITKAIQSSPEKRLTLSQIYDWMVQNVPYFKDKGDSTSSAGWKNSIRHNLSLHSRFMRIQNEGTGKSSWWVINPDAKPGKAPRRRAGSMETKSYEKKRGRVKKKAEAMRAAFENGTSPLGGDELYDSIVISGSYSEFRSRTDSNASSISRLSPIQAGGEPDLHDSQVPPMSPILWGAEEDNHNLYNGGGENFDLVDTLVGVMKISPNDSSLDAYNPNGLGPDYTSSAQSFMSAVNEYTHTHLPAPPPYPDHSPNTQAQSPLPLGSGSYTNLQPMGQSDLYGESVMEHMNSPAQLSVQQTHQQQLNSPERSQQNSPNPQAFAAHLSPQAPRASPALNSLLSSQLSPQQNRALLGSQRASPSLASSLQQQQQQAANAQSILREALTRGGLGVFTTNVNSTLTMSPPNINNTVNMLKMGLSPQQQHHQHLQHQQQMQQPPLRILSGTHSHFDSMNGPTACGMAASTVASLHSMIHTNGNNNNVPLDIDMDALISVPVDYDMDSIIKQELSLEGNLDFNFDSVVNGPTTGQSIVH